ncbi:hypothetical protein BDM02DRAFT_1510189 [Thelephora ganbajun]|uniref:Uncharacterized protein n=1 Tax=Thelephora ganbajun TaxID=370292 RepID=A0ACB6Z268_THEGA|nr:hypothetical protein BDM02DRAFT_1510189 [Thelephora ganbajun]
MRVEQTTVVNACGSVAINLKWGPSDRRRTRSGVPELIAVHFMVDGFRRAFLDPGPGYLIADYRCQACTTLTEEHRSQSLAERPENRDQRSSSYWALDQLRPPPEIFSLGVPLNMSRMFWKRQPVLGICVHDESPPSPPALSMFETCRSNLMSTPSVDCISPPM